MWALQLFWLQSPGDPLGTMAQERITQAEYSILIELRRQRLEFEEDEVYGICRAEY